MQGNGDFADSSTAEGRPRDLRSYHRLHSRSLEAREEYWGDAARRLAWERDWQRVLREDLRAGNMDWFTGAAIKPTRNAITRHLDSRGDQPALLHLSLGGATRGLSYRELARGVEAVAAALRASGLAPGDRVGLYLPPSIESVLFTLACSRAGLCYVPLALTQSYEQVSERLRDAGVRLLLVAGGEEPEFYARQRDQLLVAFAAGDGLRCVAVGESATPGAMPYREFVALAKLDEIPDEALPADSPLFILYADTFAGQPRGGIFRAGGFLVQAATNYALIMQTEGPKRILSTRSPASAMGQSFGLWGPLLGGDTLVIPPVAEQLDRALLARAQAEAAPELLVSTPRVLAGLLAELGGAPSTGPAFERVACCSDPLSPRLRRDVAAALAASPEGVLDLWSQQGSGGPLIAGFPHAELNRPGALGLPLPGVDARILNEAGSPCRANESGQLVLAVSLPGMVQEIWGQPEGLRETYFERLPGFFHTGDTARVDEQGFVWFMGSLDDVVKIGGQSLSTAEIEKLLAGHPRVAEVAVLGLHGGDADQLTAFVVPAGAETGDRAAALEAELMDYLQQRVGDFARPEQIFVAVELPRTRTGKVVRRLLRRIASGDAGPDEDLSHLANPDAVKTLITRNGPPRGEED